LTLCCDWTLVKQLPGEIDTKMLECRAWTCDRCGPKRQRRLISEVIHGDPNRFLTLTVNPAFGDSPDDRRAMLADALKLLVKRLRRWKPTETFDYFVVVERTKAGEPHFHITLRCPYVPQRLISSIMNELIHAPTVDIRAISSAKKAAYYIAKYVSKAPDQFAGFKRYFHSQNWEVDPPDENDEHHQGEPRWVVDRRPEREIARELFQAGYFRSLFSLTVTKYFPGIDHPAFELDIGGP